MFTGEADDQASGAGTLTPQQLCQLFPSDFLQFHFYCLHQQGHVTASVCLLAKKKNMHSLHSFHSLDHQTVCAPVLDTKPALTSSSPLYPSATFTPAPVSILSSGEPLHHHRTSPCPTSGAKPPPTPSASSFRLTLLPCLLTACTHLPPLHLVHLHVYFGLGVPSGA